MNIEELCAYLPEFTTALWETAQMLGIGLLSALLGGGLLGTALYLWRPGGLHENRALSSSVGFFVSTVRSFPFVILMIALGPFTRSVVGTSIGPLAAAVPLSISAVAYFARLVELSLLEVPRNIVEAVISLGASTRTTVRVLYSESASSLILGFTATAISFISYSAVAGIVGGGGLGDFAIRYGYHRYQTDVMVITMAVLVLLVHVIQFIGGKLAARYQRK